jgi:two-component system, NtrC family, response regulator AtoC
LCSGRVITASHLGVLAPPAAASPSGTLADAVGEAEYRRIMSALQQCNGNQTRAAKLLGISRGTLVSRLDRYRFPRPRK